MWAVLAQYWLNMNFERIRFHNLKSALWLLCFFWVAGVNEPTVPLVSLASTTIGSFLEAAPSCLILMFHTSMLEKEVMFK